MVGLIVVEPAYPGSKSMIWHGWCLHFSRFILEFNNIGLSVVGNVLVDIDMHMVTLLSRLIGTVFGDADRDRVYV